MLYGSLRHTGLDGYYWAESAYLSELYAYAPYFNNTSVYPANYTNRWDGFAVQKSLNFVNSPLTKHQILNN